MLSTTSTGSEAVSSSSTALMNNEITTGLEVPLDSLNLTSHSGTQRIFQAAGTPLRVQTHERIIESIPTEFLFTEYANMFQIIISQTGKMGSLYMATVDAPAIAVSMAAETYTPPTTVKCLLGQRNNILEQAYASRIVTLLVKSRLAQSPAAAADSLYSKPLLLGLSLKNVSSVASMSFEDETEDETSMETQSKTFQGVLEALKDMKVF